MTSIPESSKPTIRAFAVTDLESVVKLDKAGGNRSRRGFFVKRVQAMTREPLAFIGLTATYDEQTVGFVLARLLDGEFGGTAPVAVLDAVGVTVNWQGHGLGSELLEQLIKQARSHGCRELRTEVNWQQSQLLDFFARTGFALAPRLILERSTSGVAF